MQLAGGVAVVTAVIAAIVSVFELSFRRASPGWWLLIAALSVGRSVLHRRAGAGLLYRTTNLYRTPLVGVRRYVNFAWGHSFSVAAIFQAGLGVSTLVALSIGLGLALWPTVLAVIFSLPRFRRFRTEIPTAEDRGFEGIAVYNTLFGVAATALVAMAIALMLDEVQYGAHRASFAITWVIWAALLAGSITQVHSGLRGLGKTSFDRVVQANRRYVIVAVLGAACCMAASLLLMLLGQTWLFGLLMTLTSCSALLVWPLAIRRFVAERQFSEFMKSNDSSVFHRSPDAGLTALGWLLICAASVMASCFLTQLVASGRIGYGDAGGTAATGIGSELWNWLRWSVPFVALPAWAGFELVCMSARARVVTAAFCLTAAGSALSMLWPLVEEMFASGHWSSVAFPFAVLGFAVVVPVAIWLLVRRTLPLTPPTAIARFRGKISHDSPRSRR